MFARFREDIACVFERDPAARTTWEVLTGYPGFHALTLHRFSHWLWGHQLRWLARLSSHLGRWEVPDAAGRMTNGGADARLPRSPNRPIAQSPNRPIA